MQNHNNDQAQQDDGNKEGPSAGMVNNQAHTVEEESPTDTNQNKQIAALDKGAKRLEYVALGIAALSVLAALISAGVSYRQLQIMDDQLKDARKAAEASDRVTAETLGLMSRFAAAAEGSAKASETGVATSIEALRTTRQMVEVSRKQLESTDRAWIKVKAGAPSLSYADGKATLIIPLVVSNIGRTVALSVSSYVVFVPSRRDVFFERQRFPKIVRDMSGWHGIPGNMLFPGESQAMAHMSSIERGKLDSDRVSFTEYGAAHRRFVPAVVGVVAYEWPGSNGFHTTHFAYYLRRTSSPFTVVDPLELDVNYTTGELVFDDFGEVPGSLAD